MRQIPVYDRVYILLSTWNNDKNVGFFKKNTQSLCFSAIPLILFLHLLLWENVQENVAKNPSNHPHPGRLLRNPLDRLPQLGIRPRVLYPPVLYPPHQFSVVLPVRKGVHVGDGPGEEVRLEIFEFEFKFLLFFFGGGNSILRQYQINIYKLTVLKNIYLFLI